MNYEPLFPIIRYNTIQYNSMQYNAIQYNTKFIERPYRTRIGSAVEQRSLSSVTLFPTFEF